MFRVGPKGPPHITQPFLFCLFLFFFLLGFYSVRGGTKKRPFSSDFCGFGSFVAPPLFKIFLASKWLSSFSSSISSTPFQQTFLFFIVRFLYYFAFSSFEKGLIKHRLFERQVAFIFVLFSFVFLLLWFHWIDVFLSKLRVATKCLFPFTSSCFETCEKLSVFLFHFLQLFCHCLL